ncbi:MAG: ABC transporter permease, partial [Oscillibacter sp.]|nr:ABC transporter permease [Oscillibacter sp.]
MKKKMNGFLLAGLVITALLAVMIVLGMFWTPYDPNAMSGSEKYLSPCLAHPFGTDNFGRDILSRVMKGAGTTFSIALMTVAMGAVLGTAAGALTGYFGGVIDDVLMRL